MPPGSAPPGALPAAPPRWNADLANAVRLLPPAGVIVPPAGSTVKAGGEPIGVLAAAAAEGGGGWDLETACC